MLRKMITRCKALHNISSINKSQKVLVKDNYKKKINNKCYKNKKKKSTNNRLLFIFQ